MAISLIEQRARIAEIPLHEGGRKAEIGVPLVSIAIAVLNCGSTLSDTLDSIDQQCWPATEVIVADGGSTPETLSVIHREAPRLTRWISAPDNGIAEGFNRAVALTKGDLIQITNAADRLEKGYIRTAVTVMDRSPKLGFAYGDVHMVDHEGDATRTIRGASDFQVKPFDSMAVAPHPAMIVRRETYQSVGLFDPTYLYSMDYDWLARATSAGIGGVYEPNLVALMEEGGASKVNKMARDRENARITAKYDLMPAPRRDVRLALRLGVNVAENFAERVGAQQLAYRIRTFASRFRR